MAQRYGKLPSEIVQGSIEDFSFNLCVLAKGIENDNKIREKQARAAKTKRRY